MKQKQIDIKKKTLISKMQRKLEIQIKTKQLHIQTFHKENQSM